MKTSSITLAGDRLAKALKLCASVTERRNTYPILGMVRVAVAGEAVTVSATDLDMMLSIPLVASAASGGDWSICLPSHALAAVAQLGRDGEIVIERIGGAKGDEKSRHVRVSLDQGDLFESVSYEIEGLDAADFPEVGGDRGALIEQFGNGRFGEMLRKVAPFSSFEETRYYLNGVAWQIGKSGRRVIATDGHRLALCHYDKAPHDGDIFERVLPNKLVNLLLSLGGGDVAAYDVTIGNASSPRIEFTLADGMVVRSRCVDLPANGYPNVDRVIPRRDSFKAVMTVGVDRVRAAIERVMALSGKHTGKMVQFAGTPEGLLCLSMISLDTGSAKVTLPIGWPGAAEPFGVNGKYLKSVLGQCTGDVALHQVDAGAPVTILDEDERMTRLLMPMRV